MASISASFRPPAGDIASQMELIRNLQVESGAMEEAWQARGHPTTTQGTQRFQKSLDIRPADDSAALLVSFTDMDRLAARIAVVAIIHQFEAVDPLISKMLIRKQRSQVIQKATPTPTDDSQPLPKLNDAILSSLNQSIGKYAGFLGANPKISGMGTWEPLPLVSELELTETGERLHALQATTQQDVLDLDTERSSLTS